VTVEELRLVGPELRAAGWSYRAIGERFGVSATTAAKQLDAAFAERQRRSALRWKQLHPERNRLSHNRARDERSP
jgi:hypothetical protein